MYCRLRIYKVCLLKGVVDLNYEKFIVRMHYIFVYFVLVLYCDKLIWALKGFKMALQQTLNILNSGNNFFHCWIAISI